MTLSSPTLLFCLTASILLLASSPSSASKPISIKQQLRKKDALIADLRQQVLYLTREINHLRGTSRGQSSSNVDTGSLGDSVNSYNRMMHRAQDDMQKSGKASSDFESVMESARSLEGSPGFQDAVNTAKTITASMKRYNDDADAQTRQAAALRQSIMGSPQYTSHYTEGDLCLNAGDLGDDLRAIHADDFRFFVPLR